MSPDFLNAYDIKICGREQDCITDDTGSNSVQNNQIL